MNEQLQQRANEILLSILNKAADIGSAALDEIPLVVQELLHWKFAESIVHNLAAIICIVIAGLMFRYGSKKLMESTASCNVTANYNNGFSANYCIQC